MTVISSNTPITTQVIVKHSEEMITRWFDVSCWMCEGGEIVTLNGSPAGGAIVVESGTVSAFFTSLTEPTRLGILFTGGAVGEMAWVRVKFTYMDQKAGHVVVMMIPVAVISGREAWLPGACADIRLWQYLTAGQAIDHCAEAQAVALKALRCLQEIECCPETPVSVDGETYDHEGYVRSLRQIVIWAQQVCSEETKVTPFFAVNNPIW